MSELCAGSLAAGIIMGGLLASLVWLVWIGLTMSKVQKDMHEERLKWRHLTEEEKDEFDEVDRMVDWEEGLP